MDNRSPHSAFRVEACLEASRGLPEGFNSTTRPRTPSLLIRPCGVQASSQQVNGIITMWDVHLEKSKHQRMSQRRRSLPETYRIYEDGVPQKDNYLSLLDAMLPLVDKAAGGTAPKPISW